MNEAETRVEHQGSSCAALAELKGAGSDTESLSLNQYGADCPTRFWKLTPRS